jgi:protein Mpv17
VHPVKKQVISSGFIWGFGDIAAKSIPHHTAKKYHQIKVFISIITCHSRKSFFFI